MLEDRRPESTTNVVSDRSDDADPHFRPPDLARMQTARHEPKPVIGRAHAPCVTALLIRALDGNREKSQRCAAYCLVRD